MNRVTLLLILVAAMAGAASADVVTLANGDRITGAIVKADATALTLKTKAMGDVTIAMAEIATIQSDQPVGDAERLHGAHHLIHGKSLRMEGGPVQAGPGRAGICPSDSPFRHRRGWRR